MADLPAAVTVGPHRYTVDVDRDGRILDHGDQREFGRADHARLTITVAADIAPSQQADTLLHEVLHAIWQAVGLDQRLATAEGDDEELIVSSLAPLLLDVWRRNPELRRFLVDTAGSTVAPEPEQRILDARYQELHR